jgi:hypothetical protein
MERSLNQRNLGHGNVLGGVRRRILFGGPDIVENGQVVQVAVIPARSIWERTNP